MAAYGRCGWAAPWLALALALVVACDGRTGHDRQQPTDSAHAVISPTHSSPQGTTTFTNCGGTAVRNGNPPSWAFATQFGFRGPNQTPYAISNRGLVVAYLYGYPLAVSHPGTREDKILWFTKYGGAPLDIRGHRIGSALATYSQQISSTTAGIPSYVNVSAPGCWRFDLSWQVGAKIDHDTISILYLAHR